MSSKALGGNSSPAGKIAKDLAWMAVFGAVYLTAAWSGQFFTIAPDLGAALWPPGGIFLATLLHQPRRKWPCFIAIALAADFVASTVIFDFPGGVALAIATGNILETTVGALLLQKWAGGRFRFAGTASVFAFTLICGLISPVLSTVVGGTAVSLHTAQSLLDSWKLWWTGDSAGILIFAPLAAALLNLNGDEHDKQSATRLEVFAMLCVLLLLGHVVWSRPYPTIFIILPVLIWSAVRGNHLVSAMASSIMALQVVMYTKFNLGPFAANNTLEASQFLVQSFIMAAALTSLVLASQTYQQRKSIAELNAARTLAERASQVKSRFLANMSHEFRTPLNAVIGFGQILASMELPSAARNHVSHIQQAGEQLLALTSDVLDLTRMESSDVPLEKVAFESSPLFAAVCAMLQSQAETKGLALRFDMAPDLPKWLIGDPLRLKQILINLLSNAVKFTAAGTVTLAARTLEYQGSTVTLRFDVSDTGIGIAPEAQACIFDAFTQADSSITRRFGGTGLGLSIVRRLVELMDGQLELTSVPGQGSTFSVTLAMGVDALG